MTKLCLLLFEGEGNITNIGPFRHKGLPVVVDPFCGRLKDNFQGGRNYGTLLSKRKSMELEQKKDNHRQESSQSAKRVITTFFLGLRGRSFS